MTTTRFGDLVADMILEQQRRISDLERAAGISPTQGSMVSLDDIRRELNLLWDRDAITKGWIGPNETLQVLSAWIGKTLINMAGIQSSTEDDTNSFMVASGDRTVNG